MKKKIITSSLLGLMAFSATPTYATEQIAFTIFGASAYLNSCSTCHSGSSGNESKGNLKAGVNAAYQKDKFGLSALKAFVTVPAVALPPKCTGGQVLNSTNDACVAPPPPKCIAPKVLNATQTACITPTPICTTPQILNVAKNVCETPTPTCSATEVLKNNVCVAKPVVPTCSATEILQNNVCITKPTTPTPVPSTQNTKPVLNAVALQWDVNVGETLSIPLSVQDVEDDSFKILVNGKVTGATVSAVNVDSTNNLPSIDFIWTPTLNQVSKNAPIKIMFIAQETATKQKFKSNVIKTEIRVWASAEHNAITKLTVATSKFDASSGQLNLMGNVKFNSLFTPAERQAFIDQTHDLTIVETGDLVPLTLDSKGNWTASIPMTSAPCNITLKFDGQNASRKVVGCQKSQIVNTPTHISGESEGKNEDSDHKSGSKSDKDD